jgi:predicted aspartyl protease
MKRNLFLAGAVTTLIVVYLLVLRIEDEGFDEPARFIPESAVLYFEQRDGIDALHEFIESPLGQRLTEIDFITTGEKIDLDRHLAGFLQNLSEKATVLATDRVATTLLGKRFAVALLSPLADHRPLETERFFEENIVLVSQPEHPAALLQLLGEGYIHYTEELHLTSSQYGNHRIQRVSRGEQRLSFAVIDGFFLIALNERQLRRCIDAFDGELPALGSNRDYVELKSDFRDAAHFLYSPLDSLRALIDTLFTSYTFSYQQIVKKELDNTAGFTALAYGAWRYPGKIFDRVVVRYDRELVTELAGRHLDILPTGNTMFGLSSAEPMLYYWSNVLAFRNYLPILADDSEAKGEYARFNRQVKDITGKEIEEILPLLGREMSLVVEKGAGGSFFSFPRGLIFLRADDPLAIRQILEELGIAYDVQLTGAIHGPVEYMYWSLSPEDGLRPLYGFWDDLFFFGNSSILLKKVVDTRLQGYTLLDNELVDELDPGLRMANNSVLFIDNIAVLEVAERALDLMATVVALEDRNTATKVRVVISEIIKPLLKGARMYRAGITRSYFSSDAVVVESMTKLTKEKK